MFQNKQLSNQLAVQNKRKEKARIAARARRSQEASIIMEMANELHITQEKIRRIDKATIVKLAIDYIKAFEILCKFCGKVSFELVVQAPSLSTAAASNNSNNNISSLNTTTSILDDNQNQSILSIINNNKVIAQMPMAMSKRILKSLPPRMPMRIQEEAVEEAKEDEKLEEKEVVVNENDELENVERFVEELAEVKKIEEEIATISKQVDGCVQREEDEITIIKKTTTTTRKQYEGAEILPMPKLSTSLIFTPKTDDMDSNFLMINDDRESGRQLFVLKPDTEVLDEDDLTHLAPQAGEAIISLEVEEPLDNIVLDTSLFSLPSG